MTADSSGLRCPECFELPAYRYSEFAESADMRAMAAMADKENPVVEFVCNGIFLPLGGIADSNITSETRRLYAERQFGEEILTPGEYRYGLLSESGIDAGYLRPEGGFRHQTSLLSYHPAYSDYLPLKDLFSALGTSVRASRTLTPLVWSVPFRGRRGTYCGFVHRTNDFGDRELLKITCSANGEADILLASSIHCWRLPCPHCGWDTCVRKAREVHERIMVYRQLQLSTERRLVHVVVSPPQDVALRMIRTREGTELLWKTVFDVLKRFHVETGAVVLHPWREESDVHDDGSRSPSEIWRPGPHFHCLGFGYVPEDMTAAFAADTGIVVKVVHDDADIVSPAVMFAYLLTHAGLAHPVRAEGLGRQMKAFRYFGGLSNGEVARIAEVRLAHRATCPRCGNSLVYCDDHMTPVTSTHKTGIFTTRRHRKEETGSWRRFESDFVEHMDSFAEEGGSVREMDNYDKLWYFSRRQNVEFLGKGEFFRTGKLPVLDDGLPDVLDNFERE